MGRGPKRWDEATIERRRLEGRGEGTGPDYKPWLTVTDFSSEGTSRNPRGLKSGRNHELVSDGEFYLYLLLEWSPDVVDIREQYPLDRDLTQEIAMAIGIRHPCYPDTRVPMVLTVDFLVTQMRQGKRTLAAYNVKKQSAIEDAETLAWLEIQRAYFDGARIPHHLVFTERLPKNVVGNLNWIIGAQTKVGEVELWPGYLDELATRMAADLRHRNTDVSLTEYCANFDARCAIPKGTGLRVARLLMASRVLITDLHCNDVRDAPLVSFKLASPTGTLQAVGVR